MKAERQYCVYIMTNASNTVLYTGVTNDLLRRVDEHRQGVLAGFTKKYLVRKLVYYEVTGDIHTAIEREKQVKSWKRCKKVAMITEFNPDWHDLYDDIHG